MIQVFEYPHLVYSIPDYNGDYPVEYGAKQIGVLEKYNTLILRRRFQGVGEFSLKMPFSEEANTLTACGNLISIKGRNEHARILTKTIYKDDKGVESIEASGKYLSCMLGHRVITYSTVGTGDPVTQIKSILRNQPVLLETFSGGVYIQNINADLQPDNYGDRHFPDFHFEEPAFTYYGIGEITFQPELLSNMLDNIVSLCKAGGFGFRVIGEYYTEYADTLTMWLQLYKGADRSISQFTNHHVIYSEVLGNVLSQTYRQSIDGVKTAGYATNSAIDTLTAGSFRLIDIASGNDYYTTTASNVNGKSGLGRNELGMTINEIAAPTSGTTQQKVQSLYASCKQVGRNEIAKSEAVDAFSIKPRPGVWPVFGVDCFLGDTVTAVNARWGVQTDAMITESVETYEPGKDVDIDLTFGNAVSTPIDKMKQVARRKG